MTNTIEATDTATETADPALQAAFIEHAEAMSEAAAKLFDGFAGATRLPRSAARVAMAAALLVDCDTEDEMAELLIAIDGMIEQQDDDEEAQTGEAAS